jgi:hypothetical protein
MPVVSDRRIVSPIRIETNLRRKWVSTLSPSRCTQIEYYAPRRLPQPIVKRCLGVLVVRSAKLVESLPDPQPRFLDDVSRAQITFTAHTGVAANLFNTWSKAIHQSRASRGIPGLSISNEVAEPFRFVHVPILNKTGNQRGRGEVF